MALLVGCSGFFAAVDPLQQGTGPRPFCVVDGTMCLHMVPTDQS